MSKSTYIVISSANSGLARAIAEKYPAQCQEIVPGVAWAVAGEDLTSADVCAALGIAGGSNPQKLPGVVFRLGEFYGRWDAALWQRLDAWQSRGD